MTVQWYGQAFLRIESRDVVIAIDPFSKKPEWGIVKVPRFRADAVLISHDHEDHNNVGAIEGSPVLIQGPGEYEVKGIFIQGIPSFHDDAGGRERGPNTIFTLDIEEMRLCHMGDIGMRKLTEDILEKIGDVDVLMVPVGGTYTVDGKGAWNLVAQIEPKVVIPMHYKVPGLKLPIESADTFLKEAGGALPPVDRLAIRRKDLPEDGTKVYLLRPLAFAV